MFVAGFIGSPPMNLIDAMAVGGKGVLIDGVDVPLPAGLSARDGQEIVIGFRSESFAPAGHSLHAATNVLTVKRPVLIAEPLGTETILFAEFGGREVQGKMLNPHLVRPGETMEFTFDLSRLQMFDKATGKSLRG